MTVDDLRARELIVLECISGSRAYGLNTPTSDTDIKGVFVLPKSEYYGLNYIPQINNETNDVVFYELGRFIDLLSQNNPNILELLNTSEGDILYKHPLFEQLHSELFLSKLCANTFGKFALSQIKKAKGLKKKISRERKTPLDFCYVNYDNGSIPVTKYLEIRNWKQENCGLVNIANMRDVYGLYYSSEKLFSGIIQSDLSNDVSLSSIPKEFEQQALLFFNKDGYSFYCREYREYWEWVEKRNEERYETTASHGKNYDAKNMMHVFRLLEMAIEIGETNQINIKRPNRDFLLSIKSGQFDYDQLLNWADEKQLEMEKAFELSNLPEKPDLVKINSLLASLRDQFYQIDTFK
jgi:predicted nucleotidyltransferase